MPIIRSLFGELTGDIFDFDGEINGINIHVESTCLPNGLASAPRIFTKIMKPIFASLRTMGFINASYIDDSLLISDDLNHCQENVSETLKLIQNLGFTITF